MMKLQNEYTVTQIDELFLKRYKQDNILKSKVQDCGIEEPDEIYLFPTYMTAFDGEIKKVLTMKWEEKYTIDNKEILTKHFVMLKSKNEKIK